MRQSIDITKEEKNAMIGVKYSDIAFFNPVLNELGVWQISIQCVLGITNTDWTYLQDRIPHDYKNISEATELSDVFSSENLDDEDVPMIVNQLTDELGGNSLERPDIRFRGLNIVREDADKMMGKGILVLQSDL